MNREQVLSIAKPILYNTPMTQAVLDDRKTATRRLVKPQPTACSCAECGAKNEIIYDKITGHIRCRVCHSAMICDENGDKAKFHIPYKFGDILYVRETFTTDFSGRYYYRADFESDYLDACETLSGGYPAECVYHPGCEGCSRTETRIMWRPSIHMPKEAARIFLKVTDVRMERLQDITKEGAIKEGAETDEYLEMEEVAGITGVLCQTLRDYFGRAIWDSTIKKKADYDKYGWDANPWVWVIEFERWNSD